MDEKLIARAANKKHIAGIYNYCDRWCERCPATARCLEFEMLFNSGKASAPNDLDSKEFWEELSHTLESALNMLRDIAEASGVSAPSAPALAAAQGTPDNAFDSAHNHALARLSRDYMHAVDDWFRRETPTLQAVGTSLAQEDNLEIQGAHPADEAHAMNDCIEVIQWYRFQIHVKLIMAVMVPVEGESADTVMGLSNDGVAKVALVGIDRSIAAWARLREHLMECTDSILDLLVTLDRLRRAVEKEFPEARKFTRPGLDSEAR